MPFIDEGLSVGCFFLMFFKIDKKFTSNNYNMKIKVHNKVILQLKNEKINIYFALFIFFTDILDKQAKKHEKKHHLPYLVYKRLIKS